MARCRVWRRWRRGFGWKWSGSTPMASACALLIFERGFFELFQKHRHFLFRLLVAMGTGGLQSLFPRLFGGSVVARGLMRLAQQFPGGGVFRVEADAALQVFGRFGVFPKIEITLAEAEAQQ